MSSVDKTKCHGCGAGLGELHARSCAEAVCWHCREWYSKCQRVQARDLRFPYTGDLEPVFRFQNRHYEGMDLDDFDYWPDYENGKLVKLRANRIGPGAWRIIETSPQARDIHDLTIPMPHLSMQTADECIEDLLNSPLLPRLQVLQLGDTHRGWEGWLNGDDYPCEGQKTEGLVRLIERLPRVTQLYLSDIVPEPNPVLAATFPPLLERLLLWTHASFDLSILAENDSLRTLHSLLLQHHSDCKSSGDHFHVQFGALVNAPGLGGVADLYINMPPFDDTCCEALVTSPLVKHLTVLRLGGEGLTDRGAKVLAASPDIRGLKELVIKGRQLTEEGYAALRAAGAPLAECY